MKIVLTPSFRFVFFSALFLSVLGLGPKMLNIDGDLPRHLLMGKVILETRVIPTQEIFSYVYENRSYIPHEWLADVIYYSVYKLLGLNGVVLLSGVLIAATFTILYVEGNSHSGQHFRTFLFVLLGALVTSIHWIARPHLFSMLFLAIWLVLVNRLGRGKPLNLWVFPVLMLLWANIHAEFIAGFLVLLASIAGYGWQYLFDRPALNQKTGRDLLSIAVLSFIASAFNPVGLRTWDVVAGYLGNRYLLSHIAETQPPNFGRVEYWPQLILLGIPLLLALTRKARFRPASFFLLTGFGLMSLFSARNAHLVGVVFPYVISITPIQAAGFQPFEKIEGVIKRMEQQTTGSMWQFALAVLVGILFLMGPIGKLNRFEPSVFPVDAVEWLGNHPQSGRMFNAFDWGGYLLFRLWPEQKVFIESQTDVTGEVTQKYEAVITLQDDWQKIFEQYGIKWAIIPPQWPLARALLTQGWQTVYHDQTAIILIRSKESKVNSLGSLILKLRSIIRTLH